MNLADFHEDFMTQGQASDSFWESDGLLARLRFGAGKLLTRSSRLGQQGGHSPGFMVAIFFHDRPTTPRPQT